jgi:hypothetical protein
MGRDCSLQELRSKKGQGRQAPNMTDTYSVPISNLGEGKVHAAAEAAATLMAGGNTSKVVRQYRKRVTANIARLSRAPKAKRRRR